ncbi:MAG: GntG family PLP-dependent aldolase [Pseudomonadota bacterium]
MVALSPAPARASADLAANFRSDTQTRPSRAMLETVLAAQVGDEQGMADPTTLSLEARVAALLGKEAAVFLPSGTMCNEIAIAVHCRPGDEIICGRNSHIVGYEGGGPSAISGAVLHPLDAPRGLIAPDQVAAAVRAPSRYAPRSRLLSLEQTLNMEGGVVAPVALLAECADVARTAGLATHLDGARLMNAAIASNLPAAEHAAAFDSVWLDLSKGLGCPVGAVLAGSADFIAEAWRFKQMWGGAMRQSGVLAAMGIHALDHHVERLAEDHARAARLADHLAGLSGVAQVLPGDTNIVIWELADQAPSPDQVVDQVRAEGALIGAVGPRRLRAVTHLDVDDAAVETLASALSMVLG